MSDENIQFLKKGELIVERSPIIFKKWSSIATTKSLYRTSKIYPKTNWSMNTLKLYITHVHLFLSIIWSKC